MAYLALHAGTRGFSRGLWSENARFVDNPTAADNAIDLLFRFKRQVTTDSHSLLARRTMTAAIRRGIAYTRLTHRLIDERVEDLDCTVTGAPAVVLRPTACSGIDCCSTLVLYPRSAPAPLEWFCSEGCYESAFFSLEGPLSSPPPPPPPGENEQPGLAPPFPFAFYAQKDEQRVDVSAGAQARGVKRERS